MCLLITCLYWRFSLQSFQFNWDLQALCAFFCSCAYQSANTALVFKNNACEISRLRCKWSSFIFAAFRDISSVLVAHWFSQVWRYDKWQSFVLIQNCSIVSIWDKCKHSCLFPNVGSMSGSTDPWECNTSWQGLVFDTWEFCNWLGVLCTPLCSMLHWPLVPWRTYLIHSLIPWISYTSSLMELLCGLSSSANVCSLLLQAIWSVDMLLCMSCDSGHQSLFNFNCPIVGAILVNEMSFANDNCLASVSVSLYQRKFFLISSCLVCQGRWACDD